MQFDEIDDILGGPVPGTGYGDTVKELPPDPVDGSLGSAFESFINAGEFSYAYGTEGELGRYLFDKHVVKPRGGQVVSAEEAKKHGIKTDYPITYNQLEYRQRIKADNAQAGEELGKDMFFQDGAAQAAGAWAGLLFWEVTRPTNVGLTALIGGVGGVANTIKNTVQRYKMLKKSHQLLKLRRQKDALEAYKRAKQANKTKNYALKSAMKNAFVRNALVGGAANVAEIGGVLKHQEGFLGVEVDYTKELAAAAVAPAILNAIFKGIGLPAKAVKHGLRKAREGGIELAAKSTKPPSLEAIDEAFDDLAAEIGFSDALPGKIDQDTLPIHKRGTQASEASYEGFVKHTIGDVLKRRGSDQDFGEVLYKYLSQGGDGRPLTARARAKSKRQIQHIIDEGAPKAEMDEIRQPGMTRVKELMEVMNSKRDPEEVYLYWQSIGGQKNQMRRAIREMEGKFDDTKTVNVVDLKKYDQDIKTIKTILKEVNSKLDPEEVYLAAEDGDFGRAILRMEDATKKVKEANRTELEDMDNMLKERMGYDLKENGEMLRILSRIGFDHEVFTKMFPHFKDADSMSKWIDTHPDAGSPFNVKDAEFEQGIKDALSVEKGKRMVDETSAKRMEEKPKTLDEDVDEFLKINSKETGRLTMEINKIEGIVKVQKLKPQDTIDGVKVSELLDDVERNKLRLKELEITPQKAVEEGAKKTGLTKNEFTRIFQAFGGRRGWQTESGKKSFIKKINETIERINREKITLDENYDLIFKETRPAGELQSKVDYLDFLEKELESVDKKITKQKRKENLSERDKDVLRELEAEKQSYKQDIEERKVEIEKLEKETIKSVSDIKTLSKEMTNCKVGKG